jgi:hypothetical protein
LRQGSYAVVSFRAGALAKNVMLNRERLKISLKRAINGYTHLFDFVLPSKYD